MSPTAQDKSKQLGLSQLSKTAQARIVLYGVRENLDAIGEHLENRGVYLRNPTEHDHRLEYVNPQYLLRPGMQMPRVTNGAFRALSNSRLINDSLDEKKKAHLSQIFDSADGPAVFSEIRPSNRLRTALKKHQKKALSMMVERERGVLENAHFDTVWELSAQPDGNQLYRDTITGNSQTTRPRVAPGGILADDMGLGKTLSMLALITTSLDTLGLSMPANSRPTLVVCPKSTVAAWQQQTLKHIHPGQIRVALCYGSSKARLSPVFNTYDVILTTYGTVLSEWKTRTGPTPILSTEWARVVLDEAHHIRDRSNKIFKAACAIPAKCRWYLTGTPIQNRLDDYGSLLTFVGIAPFSSKSMFDYWIAKPLQMGQPDGLARLRRLVAATCLRRTKESIRDDIGLPPRTERECVVPMDQKDRELYDFLRVRLSSFVTGMFSDGNAETARGTGNILSLINTLRLICNHGENLVPRRVQQAWAQRLDSSNPQNDTENQSTRCIVCNAEVSLDDIASEFGCGHILCFSCANAEGSEASSVHQVLCPICSEESQSETDTSEESCNSTYRPSAKVRALTANLLDEQRSNATNTKERPIKSVVFTFLTRMLDLLEYALVGNGLKFVRIDGQKSFTQRISAISTFNGDDGCTVMIATIGSVGEG
ncbi:hypothetical protein F4677DRAFT_247519 [Hypoxylon crocopeplum]|nr:hypothetical protein F4677DRAFT_247519 [Hypoxylon crocopeplum]